MNLGLLQIVDHLDMKRCLDQTDIPGIICSYSLIKLKEQIWFQKDLIFINVP